MSDHGTKINEALVIKNENPPLKKNYFSNFKKVTILKLRIIEIFYLFERRRSENKE